MGHAIPRQRPAVVLRSQFNRVRALLVVAAIAVVGLTITAGILASDSDEFAVGARGPLPAHMPNAGQGEVPTGPLLANLPNTRYDGGPEEGTRGALPAEMPNTRYDGGPEEGTRGALPADMPNTRYDGGPEEGTPLSGARP